MPPRSAMPCSGGPITSKHWSPGRGRARSSPCGADPPSFPLRKIPTVSTWLEIYRQEGICFPPLFPASPPFSPFSPRECQEFQRPPFLSLDDRRLVIKRKTLTRLGVFHAQHRHVR